MCGRIVSVSMTLSNIHHRFVQFVSLDIFLVLWVYFVVYSRYNKHQIKIISTPLWKIVVMSLNVHHFTLSSVCV
jgi:hypothetical protein